MTKKSPILVWLRRDLRLLDNPALFLACQNSDSVIPIFIFDEEYEVDYPIGSASKWWLHHSLANLKNHFKDKLNLNLILKRGRAHDILNKVITETKAQAVYWNRNYEPSSIARDATIKKKLLEQNIDVQTFKARLLFEPWEIKNKTNQPYRVFTPFWKSCLGQSEIIQPPLPLPEKKKEQVSVAIESDDLDTWHLRPTQPNWAKDMADFWNIGENYAHDKLNSFLNHDVDDYKTARDFPNRDATSFLSPHLHFGEISPRTIWHNTQKILVQKNINDKRRDNAHHFLREIGWREFSYHLLYHYPQTPTQPLYEKFNAVPWDYNQKALTAWQKGETGIPIVDAGMKQLWKKGWMHNRVRMLVGSFLVKNLLVHWQAGASWFWDCLVDADLANNTQGWQWVAGCGADAAPYFRIFNPVTQGEKFDSNGDYIREYLPNLKNMPNKYIHKPWDAPQDVLQKAGVILGENYPKPLVDLKASREKALEAFGEMKKN